LFCIPSLPLPGQQSLSGRVFDAGAKPLEGVNVLILPDTSFVKGGISDAARTFLLSGVAAGNYLL